MTDLSADMSKTHLTKGRAKPALGRGLGSLIPSGKGAEVAASAPRDYFTCALDKIDPAEHQPRKRFDPDALADLAASIKESGLIQPLVVREREGRYELIAGERRWRASQMAGLTEVPVVVKDVSDAVAFALALIENIQRQDLNPIEEAMAYRRLLDEFEFTQAELAEQVGKSRSAIANSVRLLGLPASVIELLSVGELTPGHARALLTLEAHEAELLAAEIVEHLLTVRQTEQRVRDLKIEQPDPQGSLLDSSGEPEALAPSSPPSPAPSSSPAPAPEAAARLVERLRARLHARVQLKDKNGKGRIEIHYENPEDLQAILAKLESEG